MIKELGILGGLGPLATSYFMELVVKMTDASADCEHIPMTVCNRPDIPDRTAYILGKNAESPLPVMIHWGKKLAEQGADYIAIPCVTAHYFYDDIARAVRVPILHMIRETVVCLRENKVGRVGLMATDGTLTGGFFQKELEAGGISVAIPSADRQRRLMAIIYKGLKAGEPFSIDDFFLAEEEMRAGGAEVVVLGCTELSLLLKDRIIGSGFLDATAVLARKSVQLCSGRLKSGYDRLIT